MVTYTTEYDVPFINLPSIEYWFIASHPGCSRYQAVSLPPCGLGTRLPHTQAAVDIRSFLSPHVAWVRGYLTPRPQSISGRFSPPMWPGYEATSHPGRSRYQAVSLPLCGLGTRLPHTQAAVDIRPFLSPHVAWVRGYLTPRPQSISGRFSPPMWPGYEATSHPGRSRYQAVSLPPCGLGTRLPHTQAAVDIRPFLSPHVAWVRGYLTPRPQSISGRFSPPMWPGYEATSHPGRSRYQAVSLPPCGLGTRLPHTQAAVDIRPFLSPHVAWVRGYLTPRPQSISGRFSPPMRPQSISGCFSPPMWVGYEVPGSPLIAKNQGKC